MYAQYRSNPFYVRKLKKKAIKNYKKYVLKNKNLGTWDQIKEQNWYQNFANICLLSLKDMNSSFDSGYQKYFLL